MTYNDRQEILCQSCTNAALRERPSDDGRHSDQSTPTNERPERLPVESTVSSQHEREIVENVDPLQDFSKIQDISPAVRARLGSESFLYNHLCTHTHTRTHTHSLSLYPLSLSLSLSTLECAGCSESIHSCQSLIALDKHWHLFCFNCRKCNKLLTSEYMNRCVYVGVCVCEMGQCSL